jgi:hypothetical protein
VKEAEASLRETDVHLYALSASATGQQQSKVPKKREGKREVSSRMKVPGAIVEVMDASFVKICVRKVRPFIEATQQGTQYFLFLGDYEQ